jgi:translation initiation factor 4B
LAKRTVPEATDLLSPASTSSDAKASPFGAARPIDTAAKEKEIEEKRLAALRERKEIEDRAREEKRLAKEAAKAEKVGDADNIKENGAATIDPGKKFEILQRNEGEGSNDDGEAADPETSNGLNVDDKTVKSKETTREPKTKAAESGAWRRPSGGPKPPRNDTPRGPRGDGPSRAPRNDGPRPQRANGAPPGAIVASTQASPVESESVSHEEDGWSTVSKPKKNQRGTNQTTRAIAS